MSEPLPGPEAPAAPDGREPVAGPSSASWAIWGDLARRYGQRYNDGQEVGFLDADRRGYGLPGHWQNTGRWYASAVGVRHVAIVLRGGRYPERVLDLGCGRGALVRFLRALAVPAWGCDLGIDDIRSPWSVGGNAVALPFRDGAFDVVVALDIVEHVPADFQPLLHAELQRVCADLVLCTVPTSAPRFVLASDAGPRNHYMTVSPEDWRAHLERMGWRVEAEGAALARWGNPFDHGLDNYPFALRCRA